MALTKLVFLLALPINVFSQYTQTLTDDGKGNSIYVPTAGSTSSVAAPAATPTIIYNCQQMPLICENVAAWANSNGGTNGDLANAPLFYFDPDPVQKSGRRRTSCSCFDHDNCPNANSNGKNAGSRITDIATSTMGAVPPISPNPSNIILAGPNPGLDNNGNPKQRNPIPTIPGRFFGQGTAFSCDEFPAAVFIQGGTGAKTICAMHAWSIYQAAAVKDAGKWPLPPGSGTRWEQDWQARLHDFLRVRCSFQLLLLLLTDLLKFFAIGGSKGTNARRNWDTVYPFYFTTTTLAANAVGKGFLVVGQTTSKTVIRRNAMPVTKPLPKPAATTYVVSGDDELDRVQGDAIELEYRHKGHYQPRAIPTPAITPAPILAARQGPAATTAGSCTADFDQSGAEDLEAGDPGFDDPIDDDLSKAQCSDIQVSASDVQAAIDTLDGLGDDGYQFDNCCGGGSISCVQVAVSGTAEIMLCGGDTLDALAVRSWPIMSRVFTIPA